MEKTIALRFFDKFAPDCGTIKAHEEKIELNGFVWYGKLGSPVSQKAINMIMDRDNPRILLIHSGKSDRYWAYISDIVKEKPIKNETPDYYSDGMNFKTWFKVSKFVKADNNVISKCKVISSGEDLSYVSKHSMSPYFMIEYNDEEDCING